jgi:hypothetical protein
MGAVEQDHCLLDGARPREVIAGICVEVPSLGTAGDGVGDSGRERRRNLLFVLPILPCLDKGSDACARFLLEIRRAIVDTRDIDEEVFAAMSFR